ncbi:MAG: DUF1684 domain-containing protein [Lysobacteraceae bacterium]|nr:MAG: DUF1684 domain-containing protein [Xanthomonadaceae bacterium]
MLFPMLLSIAVAGCDRKPKEAETVPMSAEQAEYLSAENLWRMQRQEALTQPDGWTSLIGLYWITLKSHYIGSGRGSGMRLPFGPESLGMIQRNGERVFFVPEAGVALTLDGEPFKGRVELKDDRNPMPSVIGFDEGKGKMTLLWRGGRHAIRVKHADAETRTKFSAIPYWPADRQWRIKAKYVANPAGKTLPIATIVGTTEEIPNPGALVFEREGVAHRIEALDEGGSTLTLYIADRTSGHLSYGPGRYLDAPRPDADGNVVIDFNRAYNPPCAFTPFATCPLPPRENRLNLAITAGEKKYGLKH